jgi:hypothetical protein
MNIPQTIFPFIFPKLSRFYHMNFSWNSIDSIFSLTAFSLQVRLTDFTDCRTAADIEFTQIGSTKTLLSEVLKPPSSSAERYGQPLSLTILLT